MLLSQSIRICWLFMLLCSVIRIQTSSLILPHHSTAFVGKFTNIWHDIEKNIRNSLFMTSSIAQQVTEANITRMIENGPIPMKKRQYLINGWRWHTCSVVRDIDRFRHVIHKIKATGAPISSEGATTIRQCCNFVIGFNWKALLRVESEIFFPWLNELLPNSASTLFQSINIKHASIRALSCQINDLCSSLERQVVTEQKMISSSELHRSLYHMDEILLQLTGCAKDIQYIQETVFVPYIAAYVSIKDQERFNRMVVSRLGILDSQVHMVSMIEAIQHRPKELILFQQQIPKFAQVLIPVWRNRLYRPRTACLDGRGLNED